MTNPLDRFHDRVRRNVNDLTPKIAAAYLAGLTALLALIEDERALLLAGNVEGFIAQVLTDKNLDLAFAKYRAALIDAFRDSMRSTARTIPGITNAQVNALPNILDPKTIEAIRQLDRLAMERIAEEVRAMVRAAYQQGSTPREALDIIRRSVGLGPSQVAEVGMFHVAELAQEPSLTASEIEASIVRYSERRIAANAATVARTSALMAHKQANDLAWQYAEESGLVPAGMRLFKTWRQVPRPTRRLTHEQMNGERVPLNVAYSNGQSIPGVNPDGTWDWNCACTSQVTMAVA